MKKFYTLKKLFLLVLLILTGFISKAQTVLVDDFTRADNTTVGGGMDRN
jgi:hypothetical protein